MDTQSAAAATLSSRLDLEIGLVREAVFMVAAHVAPRVVVAGLRCGEALLDSARQLGAAAGVVIVPLWPVDETGVDIAVESRDR